MSTTTISHPSASIPLFTQLVHRLRYTNARYKQIAHQCRRTQRPTHHAKRRAYRAGLRIDTSKARAAWHDRHISTSSIQLLPILDRTAVGSLVTEEDECMPSLGLALRNLPEVVVQKQPAAFCSSPFGHGHGLDLNVDDSDACDMPFWGLVPGAPRWKSKPLPEDECGTEAMTLQSVSRCTYDPVWRGVTTTHVSMSFDVAYAGLGITVPPRRLKRKLRDVEAGGSPMFSRQLEVGPPDDGYFSGTWWSEAQRRRGGL